MMIKSLSFIIFFVGAGIGTLLFFGSIYQGNVPIDFAAYANTLMILGIGLYIFSSKGIKNNG